MADNKFNMKAGALLPSGSSWVITCFVENLSQTFSIPLQVYPEDGVQILPTSKDVIFDKALWSRSQSSYQLLFDSIIEKGITHFIIPIAYPYLSDEKFHNVLSELSKRGIILVGIVFETPAFSEMREVVQSLSTIIVFNNQDRYSVIIHGVSSENIKVLKFPFSEGSDFNSINLKNDQSIQNILIPSVGLSKNDYKSIVEAVYEISLKGGNVRFVISRAPFSCHMQEKMDLSFPQEFIDAIELRGLSQRILLIESVDSISHLKSLVMEADAILLLGNAAGATLEHNGFTLLGLEQGKLLIRTQEIPLVGLNDLSILIESYGSTSFGATLAELLTSSDIKNELRENYILWMEDISFHWIHAFESIIPLNVENKNEGIISLDRCDLGSVISLGHAMPRILLQNRENAFTHPGGDTVVMERLRDGLEAEGFDVQIDLTTSANVKDFDLVHLFNFAIREVTEAQAKNCIAHNVPYVVTTLYEDWPVFFNQMAQMYVALEAYINNGQPQSRWLELENAAREVPGSQAWDNTFSATNAEILCATGVNEELSLKRDYPAAKRIESVHLGCEVSELRDGGRLFREKYGIDDFILCVGRLEWRKNQLMLLKALEDSDITIVFAASNFTYQPQYSSLCRSFKRKGNTHFLERLTTEELASAYQAARVHALPSWFELPGLVSLEAGRYGTALVVSDTGTTRNYTLDFAEYCCPDSAESIKLAVERAYYNGAKDGAERHFANYTWSHTVKSYADIYRRVLGSKIDLENSASDSPVLAMNDSMVIADNIHPSDEMISLIDQEIITLNDNFQAEVEVSSLEQPKVNSLSYEELCIKGDRALADGNPEKASEFFEEAYEIDSSLPRAIRSLGVVLFYSGKNKEAEPFFSKALSCDPRDVRSMLGKGAILWAKGEKEKAYMLYKQASDIAPDDTSVVLYLVNASYELSKLSELETALRRYLRKNSSNLSIQYCLAGCYFEQEKLSAANGILERMLAVSPQHVEALELKSEIQKRLESLNNVEVLPSESESRDSTTLNQSINSVYVGSDVEKNIGLEESIEIVPLSHATFSDGEKQILELQKLKTAKEYDSVLSKIENLLLEEIYSTKAKDHFKLIKAEVLGAQGQIEEAEGLFDYLIDKEVHSAKAFAGKGALAAYRKEWSEASVSFEKALECDPSLDIPLAGLGICAHSLGEFEDSWNYFTESLKRNPENIQSLLGLIQLGYELNRIKEVEIHLRDYLEIKPVDLSMIYSLAGCLYAQGRTQEAVSELKSILIFEPKNSNAQELLEKIEDGIGFQQGM